MKDSDPTVSFRFDTVDLRVRVDDVEHTSRRGMPSGIPSYHGSRVEELCYQVERVAEEMKAHLRKQPIPGDPEPLVPLDTWERALMGDVGGDPRRAVSNYLVSLYRRAVAAGAGEVDRLRAVCIELQRQLNAHIEREIQRAHLLGPVRVFPGPIPPDSPPHPREP